MKHTQQRGRRGRSRWSSAALATAATLSTFAIAGCSASQGMPGAASPHPSGVHTMADGSVMSDAEMDAMGSDGGGDPGGMGEMSAQRADGPSPAASMICSDEIADAVRRNLALPVAPRPTDSWNGRIFSCDYPVGQGELHLSVRDTTAAAAGRAWFEALRTRLPAPRTIKGLQAFGLPAFETGRGDVAFLKDHKTLWVDASDVHRADLPPGFSRTAVAYGVAAAVVACWSE